MREFFRGWRRQIGMVTLMTALLFMGIWLRSLDRREAMVLSQGEHHIVRLASIHACVMLELLESDGLIVADANTISIHAKMWMPPPLGEGTCSHPFLYSLEPVAASHGYDGLGYVEPMHEVQWT